MSESSEQFTNQVIRCRRCGTEFIWSAGEQRFFTKHGFLPPSSCQRCREERKQERAERDLMAQNALAQLVAEREVTNELTMPYVAAALGVTRGNR